MENTWSKISQVIYRVFLDKNGYNPSSFCVYANHLAASCSSICRANLNSIKSIRYNSVQQIDNLVILNCNHGSFYLNLLERINESWRIKSDILFLFE